MFNSFGTVVSGELLLGGSAALTDTQLSCAKAINALYIETKVGSVESATLELQMSGGTLNAGLILNGNTETIITGYTFNSDRDVLEVVGGSSITRAVLDLTYIATDGFVELPLYPSALACNDTTITSNEEITISVKSPITLNVVGNVVDLGLDYVGLVDVAASGFGLTSINGAIVDDLGNINIVSATDTITITTSTPEEETE